MRSRLQLACCQLLFLSTIASSAQTPPTTTDVTINENQGVEDSVEDWFYNFPVSYFLEETVEDMMTLYPHLTAEANIHPTVDATGTDEHQATVGEAWKYPTEGSSNANQSVEASVEDGTTTYQPPTAEANHHHTIGATSTDKDQDKALEHGMEGSSDANQSFEARVEDETSRCCNWCKVTASRVWRKGAGGVRLCNTCGQTWSKNGVLPSGGKWRRRHHRIVPPASGMCIRCETPNVKKWRRGPDGVSNFCEKCNKNYLNFKKKYALAQLKRLEISNEQMPFDVSDQGLTIQEAWNEELTARKERKIVLEEKKANQAEKEGKGALKQRRQPNQNFVQGSSDANQSVEASVEDGTTVFQHATTETTPPWAVDEVFNYGMEVSSFQTAASNNVPLEYQDTVEANQAQTLPTWLDQEQATVDVDAPSMMALNALAMNTRIVSPASGICQECNISEPYERHKGPDGVSNLCHSCGPKLTEKRAELMRLPDNHNHAEGSNNGNGVLPSGAKCKKRKRASGKCQECNISESYAWHKGPDGNSNLCHSCGQKSKKKNSSDRLNRKHGSKNGNDVLPSGANVEESMETRMYEPATSEANHIDAMSLLSAVPLSPCVAHTSQGLPPSSDPMIAASSFPGIPTPQTSKGHKPLSTHPEAIRTRKRHDTARAVPLLTKTDEHQAKASFTCRYCKETFNNIHRRDNHTRKRRLNLGKCTKVDADEHQAKASFTCRYCKETFNTIHRRDNHTRKRRKNLGKCTKSDAGSSSTRIEEGGEEFGV